MPPNVMILIMLEWDVFCDDLLPLLFYAKSLSVKQERLKILMIFLDISPRGYL